MPPTNAIDNQYNTLIDIVKSLGVGFSQHQLSSIGKKVITSLSSALWYIDCHHDKFLNRSITIPEPFCQLKDMYDWKASHKAKPTVC
jgi:hypothetical protein